MYFQRIPLLPDLACFLRELMKRSSSHKQRSMRNNFGTVHCNLRFKAELKEL